MFTAINCILLIFFIYYTIRIFSPSFDHKRWVTYYEDRNYVVEINRLMYYTIFVVCTAPFFLGQFSIAKYATYFITLIWLIYKGNIHLKFDAIVNSYLLFYIWLIICIPVSKYQIDGIMLVIKYAIPLLSLWLGYSAIQEDSDIFYFAKYVIKWSIYYALFIGGISAVLTPWIYFTLAQVFLTYAGLADYFTSIIGLCFVLVWLSGSYKFYYNAAWLLLSSLLEVVRTGIGGITIVSSMFFLARYKLKAVPAILFCGVLFLCMVLYVPEVNKKFFGNKAGTVTVEDIIQGNAMSSNKIQTNGRNHIWKILMKKFYEPHKLIGAGLGTSTGYMKDKVSGYKESNITLIHSDYVQILCDSGLVGLVLLIVFFVILFMQVGTIAFSNGLIYTKITAALAVASMAGVAFSMGYDNVVSHSMTSLINPFLFIGFFLKYKELGK